ncbi:MAG: gamma carbonic anhydrase family protein [bacterium]|nr:gamma carbonic anhydrase family protein [bacterium]
MIYELDDLKPKLAPDVFVAPDAQVIGDVKIGTGSGVWFGCVVRGDVHYITIGENTNVQDLSMLHVTGGKFPLIIGNNCTLGHRVTLHGCTLRDYAFVGIGATAMDDTEMGEFSLLAAGALLTPGKKIPPRMVAMGSPAKVVREITPEEEAMIRNIPAKYTALRERYRPENGFREFTGRG